MTAECRIDMVEDGRILVVTLDHSPNNAVTPGMLEMLGEAVDRVEESSGLSLGLLQGTGRVFSKGYDVEVIRGHCTPGEHRQELHLGNDVCLRLANASKPWIAAINGACLGAGLELALACQFRLCAEKVRLGLPELGQGLLPGLGGIHRLTKLVGRARALEMIVAGVLVTADDAAKMGLVHRVIEGDFEAGVKSFARGLLAVDVRLVQEVLRLTALAEWQGDRDCVMETIDAILRTAKN
jgi:enoyl-CoA hydratase/carnithine racemase